MSISIKQTMHAEWYSIAFTQLTYKYSMGSHSSRSDQSCTQWIIVNHSQSAYLSIPGLHY